MRTPPITLLLVGLCSLANAADEVIRKGYAILETIHSSQKRSDSEKELAFGTFVAAIRKDLVSGRLLRSTALSGPDFKHFAVVDASRPEA